MKILKKVKINSISDNTEPKYVVPKAVKYQRDGDKEKIWEIVETHNSVHILVDNTESRCIEIVEQVRIPVLIKGTSDGICSEICAGIIDKDCSIEQIAIEELIEEMGYEVSIDDITHIRKYLSGVGTQGSDVHTFSVKVTEENRVNEGGGLPSEDIRIRKIPYEDVIDFIYGYGEYKDINTDATTLFLMSTWFIDSIN